MWTEFYDMHSGGNLKTQWETIFIEAPEDEAVKIQEIFTFERVGVDDAGKVMGRFKAVCKQPNMLTRIKQYGIQLPGDLFEEEVPVNL